MKLLGTFLLAGALLSAAPVGTQVELTSPGDPTNVIVGNIYVSPYTMQMNGQTYAAMCIDFLNDSYLNTPWQANITSLASGNFSNTYVGLNSSLAINPNPAIDYAEEAYLYSAITSLSTSDPNYKTERTDIQEAAWEITDTSYTPTDPSGAANALALAENNYGSVNLADFEIVSDVNTGSGRNQEFIVCTPEPESLTLLAGGLLLIGVGAWRKRLAKAAVNQVQA